MTSTIHPFPARMAPDLALQSLGKLAPKGVILDPMMGSGSVLRHANDLGFRAIGFDLDPLAVLMARVWTSPVRDEVVESIYDRARRIALAVNWNDISLPWIDDDHETLAFVRYWFGQNQIKELRCISYAIWQLASDLRRKEERAALDVVKIALSRIIVTKEQCASLARDTSHSRPHRVALESNYSVFSGLDRSIKMVRKRLSDNPAKGGAQVKLGDARSLKLPDSSVDAVLTSPPYLNAIDYMRGHRMSLVWLGHKLSALRSVRSTSIGAERAPDQALTNDEVRRAFGEFETLPNRYQAMVDRYAGDIISMVNEVKRVLQPSGSATFVVGNSCLKGTFIRNADAVAKAAEMAGLTLVQRYERDLPASSRYLPTGVGSALHKRMRTETILTLAA